MELISLHVPKTAGTAFTDVLVRNYGKEGVYLDYQKKNLDAIGPEARVIHGHFSVQRYLDDFRGAPRIAWLRHPVNWMISFYYFSKNGPRLEGDKLRCDLHDGDLSLLEFAEHPKARNVISSQFFLGMDLEEFLFLGVQEHFREDLQDLGRLLGWRNVETRVDNANPQPGYRGRVQAHLNDAALVRRLEALNEADIETYERVVKLRARRRSRSIFRLTRISQRLGAVRTLLRYPRAA
ncbi:MAG: hypothetical protein WBC44_00270 [Planctomycetaceae bacterium]